MKGCDDLNKTYEVTLLYISTDGGKTRSYIKDIATSPDPDHEDKLRVSFEMTDDNDVQSAMPIDPKDRMDAVKLVGRMLMASGMKPEEIARALHWQDATLHVLPPDDKDKAATK